MTTATDIQQRLEYLRGQIRAESISYGEIAELQGLAEHIDPSDVELLEWAGVPEYPEGVRVSLVRVENEWHAFSDMRQAWAFYQEWTQYRDCEFLGDVPVDASLPDDEGNTR